jgi:hypothetical protein
MMAPDGTAVDRTALPIVNCICLFGGARPPKLDTMKLAIDLTDTQAERLRSEAARLGVEPAELARAALADLLSEEGDQEFRRAAEAVLRKNQELYRRLA